MVEDIMAKYESRVVPFLKGAGIVGLSIGIGKPDTNICIAGGSLLIAGYATDAINYMRGYFNERLNLLKGALKSGDLEKETSSS